ncbi:MAG: M12 family metallopeptidase [Lacipirellulaceae bacterium]
MVQSRDSVIAVARRSQYSPEGENMGLVANNTARRWPGNVVPFTIDPGIAGNATALGFVNAAIQHWNTNTPFRLNPRTSEPDFVIFTPSPNACSSPVGRNGGPQQISCALASGGFNAGSVIHEIGHAVGFWHEQGRSDRNANVTIVIAAIQPAQLHNFNQHIADGTDIGPYDFGSIMHYPRSAFPITPGTTTIIAPVPIGVTSVLSSGDIATANWLANSQTASGFASLGGVITTDPTVSRNADGRLEVFARGTDNALHHIWQNSAGGGWSGWNSLGGGLTGNAAVAINHDGRLEVFVRGTDNALWHRWQKTAGGAWT